MQVLHNDFQFLNNLSMDNGDKKLKFRIARIWKGINRAQLDKLLSLEFIAVDSQVNYT